MVAVWRQVSPAAQAQLRSSHMQELCWWDWDNRPAWWWQKTHATLLELKVACGREASRQHPTGSQGKNQGTTMKDSVCVERELEDSMEDEHAQDG
jgi:hypothetical protein